MRSLRRTVAAALSLFGVALLAVAQNGGLPEPDNLPAQRIGPHDLLRISVYEAPEFSRTVRVGADGRIRLPMLAQAVLAAGRLPSELEAAVSEALRAEKLLVEPVVTVTVVEYRSRPVRVVGAVKHPVTFQAAGRITLLDAVARAGGLSPEAGPVILVSRRSDEGPSSEVARIPVKELIEAADPAFNLTLEGGEEIRVPEAGRIFVVGCVRRPGAFVLQEDADSSVLRALALAEGLAPYAAKRAYIYRRDPQTGVRREIPVELKRILERKAPDAPLEAGDIFYVPDNNNRRLTASVLDRITGFGAATLSGILIWRR
ncbi:MAG: polysaccharide biosynthesis/export family protein [Bryobacterales bacterium]|nr:polysaccharide export protein [Bryobacteraceae bacterium]MDW8355188.1 polysaccharide biosynthesis/export family protein [Bryobacterales bacterium]